MKRKKHSPHKEPLTKQNQTTIAHLTEYSEEAQRKLEVVLKCDSAGSEEAVISSLEREKNPEAEVKVIRAGVGAITKSDLLMAFTGSKLVVGFNVDLMPKIEDLCKEQGVEVRLYEVIYKLTNDLKKMAASLLPPEAYEKITGKGKVIALFKSSRKGTILGCEVLEGTLAMGEKFRVISAIGPIYTGKIQSLHIEKEAVQMAKVGQKVGLKISDFKKAKVGDQVECFKVVGSRDFKPWRPTGKILRYHS